MISTNTLYSGALFEDKYSPISIENANKYIDEFLDGDFEAREKIICSFLRLVPYVAKKYTGLGIDYDDLIAEGNMAIVKAVDLIKKEKLTRVSVYIYRAIRNRLLNVINSQDGVITIPRSLKQRKIRIDKSEEKFLNDHGRKPTNEELSDITGINPYRLYDYRLNRNYIYLDDFWEHDIIEGESINMPFDKMMYEESNENFDRIMGCLDEREKETVIRHLGINCEKETFEKISKSINITKARSFQIYNRAIEKMNLNMGVLSGR